MSLSRWYQNSCVQVDFFLILIQTLKSKNNNNNNNSVSPLGAVAALTQCRVSVRATPSLSTWVGFQRCSGLRRNLRFIFTRVPTLDFLLSGTPLFTPSVTGCVQASSPALPGNTRPLTAGSSRNHDDLPDAKCILFSPAELQKERGRNLRSPSICRQITLKAVLAVGIQLPSERRVSHLNNAN